MKQAILSVLENGNHKELVIADIVEDLKELEKKFWALQYLVDLEYDINLMDE